MAMYTLSAPLAVQLTRTGCDGTENETSTAGHVGPLTEKDRICGPDGAVAGGFVAGGLVAGGLVAGAAVVGGAVVATAVVAAADVVDSATVVDVVDDVDDVDDLLGDDLDQGLDDIEDEVMGDDQAAE